MTAIKTKSTTVAKGFALYVGISEQDAQDAGLTLAQIAQALKLQLNLRLTRRLRPRG